MANSTATRRPCRDAYVCELPNASLLHAVDLAASTARALGAIEHLIRMLDETLPAAFPGRVGGDPHARADRNTPLSYLHRCLDGCEDVVRHTLRVGVAANTAQRDAEFIAAEARGHVGRTDHALQAPRELLQHRITGGMAE